MLTDLRNLLRRRIDTESRGQEPDDGFTLIELLVSMGIFAVILTIFMAAVAQMSKDTIRVSNTQAGQDELTRAYNRLDHSLRYAEAVNYPVLSASNNWYLEYLTTATSNGQPDFCTQYQLNSTADTLAYRTWTDGTLATLSGWTVTASRMINSPIVAGQQPFTLIPAGGIYRNQSVQILLMTQNGGSAVQQLNTTIVAVNSSGDSLSNVAAATVPVTSLTPVCTGITEP
jgi:prepilin-type N-terminal cleavage/methylation domain-containing protein